MFSSAISSIGNVLPVVAKVAVSSNPVAAVAQEVVKHVVTEVVDNTYSSKGSMNNNKPTSKGISIFC